MEYASLKQLHVLFAIISISGFVFRSALKFRQHRLLQHRLLKVLPHINDTLLLLSAIGLVLLGPHSLQQPWLLTKIVLLCVYIGFGLLTLRFAGTRSAQLLYFCLAVLTFAWMIGVALSKSPLPFV